VTALPLGNDLDPDAGSASCTRHGRRPEVCRDLGKLFASVGLKADDQILAMVTKGRLVVKLPKGRVDALVEGGHAAQFDPGYGRLMKECAAILGDEPDRGGLVGEAFELSAVFASRSTLTCDEGPTEETTAWPNYCLNTPS
jgi:hypothetical protein